MDPFAPNTAEWNEIAQTISFLTIALLSAFITGPSLLTAHAIIPSLVGTKTISEKYNKLRPVFYLIGFIGLACIITFFCLAYVNIYDVLQRIYPSFWQ
jgi:hypothetical protein|tara:strand:+ start:21126 stop:21419 length:294 start_codon:yes stop_codon:yes gene_type:complete